jgi:hypothetical protein
MLRYLTSLAFIGAIMLLALSPGQASAHWLGANDLCASMDFPRAPDGMQ